MVGRLANFRNDILGFRRWTSYNHLPNPPCKFVTGRRGRAARRKLKGLGKIVALLPKDEVDVMILRTEEEVKMVKENPDVLRVEKGMHDTWQQSYTPLTIFVTRVLTFDLSTYRPQGLFDTNGRSPVRNQHGAGCSSR